MSDWYIRPDGKYWTAAPQKLSEAIAEIPAVEFELLAQKTCDFRMTPGFVQKLQNTIYDLGVYNSFWRHPGIIEQLQSWLGSNSPELLFLLLRYLQQDDFHFFLLWEGSMEKFMADYAALEADELAWAS